MHFLLSGAALFLFYDLTREQGSEAPNRIVVNSGQVEQLAANIYENGEGVWVLEVVDEFNNSNSLLSNHHAKVKNKGILQMPVSGSFR